MAQRRENYFGMNTYHEESEYNGRDASQAPSHDTSYTRNHQVFYYHAGPSTINSYAHDAAPTSQHHGQLSHSAYPATHFNSAYEQHQFTTVQHERSQYPPTNPRDYSPTYWSQSSSQRSYSEAQNTRLHRPYVAPTGQTLVVINQPAVSPSGVRSPPYHQMYQPVIYPESIGHLAPHYNKNSFNYSAESSQGQLHSVAHTFRKPRIDMILIRIINAHPLRQHYDEHYHRKIQLHSNQRRPVEEPCHDGSTNGYKLRIRQQPKQARVYALKDTTDRRPIDPPPILDIEPQNKDDQTFLDNPHLFVQAYLIDVDTKKIISYAHGMHPLAGNCVQSSICMQYKNEEYRAFFIFGDISIRIEGKYCLKFVLLEREDSGKCKKLAQITTDQFIAYLGKDFSGMSKSTELTRALADQGARIRIRKEDRMTSKKNRKSHGEVDNLNSSNKNSKQDEVEECDEYEVAPSNDWDTDDETESSEQTSKPSNVADQFSDNRPKKDNDCFAALALKFNHSDGCDNGTNFSENTLNQLSTPGTPIPYLRASPDAVRDCTCIASVA
ncbi:velvet factor-domain-containing protein [Syncephalis fuscata]|nr:velvet factor-domain-containing protein [Syncephalis fuscata]